MALKCHFVLQSQGLMLQRGLCNGIVFLVQSLFILKTGHSPGKCRCANITDGTQGRGLKLVFFTLHKDR